MTHVEFWLDAGHVEAPPPWSRDCRSSLPMRRQAAPPTSIAPLSPPLSLPIIQGCLWNPAGKGERWDPREPQGDPPMSWQQPAWGSVGLCKLSLPWNLRKTPQFSAWPSHFIS